MYLRTRFLLGIEYPLALIAKLCTYISGLCLIILVVTFGWLVFGRYVLNSTPTWVEQLALLLVVLITFFSSAVGIKERTHLSVELLPHVLAQRPRSMLYILIYLILGAFGIVMIFQSYELMVFNWTTIIPLLDIPSGLHNLPMVISGGLVALFSLGNIFQELTALLEISIYDNIETLKQSEQTTLSEEKS